MVQFPVDKLNAALATRAGKKLPERCWHIPRRGQPYEEVDLSRVSASPGDNYYLGKLCPRGHSYEGSGGSLRRKKNNHCVRCNHEHNKVWRAANPEHDRGHKRERDLRRFGITMAEYQALSDAQDGRCAICGAQPNGKALAVDHCHSSAKVRGLLCSSCNTAIGLLKDSPGLLRKAIDYLS